MSDRRAIVRAEGVAPVVNPARLRLARELLGLTQGELGDLAGLSAATVSQLEGGKTRPTAPSLVAIAGATGHPVEYFAHHRGDAEFTGFFRSLRSSPARERKRALAWAHLLHDFALALEVEVRLPPLDVPRHLVGTDAPRESVEEIAAKVREAWEMPAGPVDHAIGTIERRGVVVAALPLNRLDLDAFSAWFFDRPVMVLGKDKQVAARTRFDAAHELGHLVMHEPACAGTRLAETQAHQFAAAFLMPEKDILGDLPARVDWRWLMGMKVEWGVSMQALLMRAKSLGVMSEAMYVNAMKQVSARGWRKQEPGDHQLGEPETPRMIEAAILRLASQDLSFEDIARQAGLPADHLRSLLALTVDQRPVVEF